MDLRKPLQMSSLSSVAFLPLVVLLVITGCSMQSPYDEAVGLINQKQYDEAKEVLHSISTDDPSASKAAVGILVCEMGTLYKKGEYERAYDVLNKTGEKDGKRYYLLNISPSDSLFAHAATLAHLVAGEMVIKEARDYNADYADHPEDYGEDSEMMNWNLRIVAEGVEAQHREVDYVDDSGQDDSPPYIASIGIPNLPSAEEWKTELDKLSTQINQQLTDISELSTKAKSAYEDRMASEALAALSFTSVDEAIEWLTDGIWATAKVDHPEYGEVRVSSSFSRGGIAKTALIDFNSQRAFNTESERYRVGSVQGVMINIIMSGGSSIVTKTGEHTCLVDGMPMSRFK